MKKPVFPCSATLLVALSLAACGLAPSPQAQPAPTQVDTLPPRPSSLPSSTKPPAASPIPTQMAPTLVQATLQSVTTLPASSPTPICNRVALGNPGDVTIPDGSELKPGQVFTKIWRLVNKGACTWTPHYAVIWFSGEQFGAPVTTYLSKQVPPNHEIDIDLDMVAPLKPGTYQSNWKLESPEGNLIGIGPNGNSPFWVRIMVVEPETSQEAMDTQPYHASRLLVFSLIP